MRASRSPVRVGLLTGGGDRPYALGLVGSLASAGAHVDFIGSNQLDAPELHTTDGIAFLNFRGDASSAGTPVEKVQRVTRYYLRLLRYAITAQPRIFHILWHNKFEFIDRTLLVAYYKLCGRRVVITVHNVNARKRDGDDTALHQWMLRTHYRLVDHMFVHTELMRTELQTEFSVPSDKITVIPFGVNDTVPDTALTPAEARRQLGLQPTDKVALFFGNIAPYKGVEYLVEALGIARRQVPGIKLLIAGRPKGHVDYWNDVRARITALGLDDAIIARAEFVPDEETEIYFKAADVLVLPYLHVFQSGVLFLGYNFGLPVIASDVASMKDDVVQGVTGWSVPPRDANALAGALARHFSSDLFLTLPATRPRIRAFAHERYSWATVAAITMGVYGTLAPSQIDPSHGHS